MKIDLESKNQQRALYLITSLTLLLLSFIIKVHRIESGNYVVWDESHFGKFASSYLKREFYFDVHPPLGKLMTAFSGLIANQDTSFKFESGEKYPENVDYVLMRRCHAFIGSFVPIFAFNTLLELGYTLLWATLLSLLLIFENGFVSISRLILLDSHLLFFTSAAMYTFIRFIKRKNCEENLSLFLLGSSIGLVLSVKWIGCFTTLFVGIHIIHELYFVLKHHPINTFVRKFLIRFIFLVVWPISIYIFWFIVHFYILENSDPSEAQMSSIFQLSLKGNKDHRIGKFIDYGYTITLKNAKIGGGNLHSHKQKYLDSDINQVTIYHHKDVNDNWAFQKIEDNGVKIGFLSNKDNVVLKHLETNQYLCAFDLDGKIVAGGGELSQNCVWVLETHSDVIKKEEVVKSLSTKFKMVNKSTGFYLTSTDNNLPEWGFGQGEVICTKDVNDGSFWNIEKNESYSKENVEYKEIRSLKNLFFLNFFELNYAMLKVNGSFKADEDLEPPVIVSKPYEWFSVRRGLRMVSWDDGNMKFYMFNNPFIWFLSSIAIILSPLILLFKRIKAKREGIEKNFKEETVEVLFYFGGWACHYLPFFAIGRVLYFHHYFPALLFSILSIGYVLKHAKWCLKLVIFSTITSFLLFSPLTYGFKDLGILNHFRILKSWDY